MCLYLLHSVGSAARRLCSENTVGALWLSSSACVGPSLHTDCVHSDDTSSAAFSVYGLNNAQVWC